MEDVEQLRNNQYDDDEEEMTISDVRHKFRIFLELEFSATY